MMRSFSEPLEQGVDVKRLLLSWCSLALAVGCAPRLPEATPTERDVVPISEGGPIDFDDIFFSRDAGRIVGAGLASRAVLIDPQTLELTTFGTEDAASASANAEEVYVLDRSTGEVVAYDQATGEKVASTTVQGADYVRPRPFTDEVWVTRPGDGQVQILHRTEEGFRDGAVVDARSGPEGLVFSSDGARAFAMSFGGDMLELVAGAAPEQSGTGCWGGHGIPAINEDDGVVFAGCVGASIVSISTEDGTRRDSFPLESGGESLMAYSSATGHAYLRGDPGLLIAVLDVSDDGSLELLGTVESTDRGHCLTADDVGNVWTCDADGGALVRIADPF